MGRKQIFDREEFFKLFYEENLSYKEISEILNVPASTLSCYRWENKLPKRGWGHGHPFAGKHHSQKTKEAISKKRKGLLVKEDNPNWKGGKYITKQGYIMVRVDNHPFAYNNYIREHRYIMEQKIGRYLDKSEHVHHINGDKTDNNIDNLILFHNNSEHLKFHYSKGSKFGINSKKLN